MNVFADTRSRQMQLRVVVDVVVVVAQLFTCLARQGDRDAARCWQYSGVCSGGARPILKLTLAHIH